MKTSKLSIGSTVSSMNQEVPTLLRIKRKAASHTEQQTDPSNDKILNLLITKKRLKFSLEESKVFTYFKTVGGALPSESSAPTDNTGSSPSAEVCDQVSPLGQSAREETKYMGQQHRSPVKKPFYQPASIDHVKQVLSSKMVQKAKDTRYRLRDEKRKRQLVQDGITYTVVDIERDDGIDPLTRSLEAMTQEFLNSKLDDVASGDEDDGKKSDSEDGLYDLYICNHSLPLADALSSGLVGTLEMDDDTLYIEDAPTASDIGSDSDSNAEDYYKNDYPDEDDDDFQNRYPRIYASSQEEESNDSDYY